MGEPNNDDRAGWAEAAIQAFMEVTRTDREDALADLLGDLQHWAEREPTESPETYFASQMARADGYYHEEKAEEKEDRDAGQIAKRLEQLRVELRAERISYGELAELQALAAHIAPDDVELLEAAGVPEHKKTRRHIVVVGIAKKEGGKQ